MLITYNRGIDILSKICPEIVPLSPYTPQCCFGVEARAFFGYQINYNIEKTSVVFVLKCGLISATRSIATWCEGGKGVTNIVN